MRPACLSASLIAATLTTGPAAAQAPLPLQILASFSMPEASLQALARQAAKLQLPLTLRGLHQDSLAATAARSARLLKAAPGATLAVDPGPFRRHAITDVPALVLAVPEMDCQAQCTAKASGIAVGDVGLDYALHKLAAHADPAVAAAARHYLRLLGETP